MLSEEGRNSPRSVRLSSPSDKLEEQAPQRDPHTEEGKVPFQLAESLRKKAKQDGIIKVSFRVMHVHQIKS